MSDEWRQRTPQQAREYWNSKTPQEQKEEWASTHQEWELHYHKGGNYRHREKLWNEVWKNVYSGFVEFEKNQFQKENVLLDLGCGSRPALSWFTQGEKYHLDPLLDNFVTIPAMADFWKKESNLLSQPAETLVESLVGKCDFVQCWNVLDHTYDWRKIVANFSQYAKPGAIALMGTDLGPTPSIGHTGIDDPQELTAMIEQDFEVIKLVDLKKGKRFEYCRNLCLKLRRKD